MQNSGIKASIYITITMLLIIMILLVIWCVYYEKTEENNAFFSIDPEIVTKIIEEKKEQISTD